MLYYYAIALVVFLVDQATKWYIVTNFELYETKSIIGDFFVITSHRNTGAAFGILQNQRWLFLILTVIIVSGIIWYLHRMIKEKRKLLSYSLSLIMGGALGNFIDRASSGEVVDFLQFHFDFINYTYPIFNIADSAICIGVALIFIDTIREWRLEKRRLVKDDQS